MVNYRNISDNNSFSSTNCPSTSNSTLSLPYPSVSVSETVLDSGDISNLSPTDFSSASRSAIWLPNTPVGVSERVSYDNASTDTSLGNKSLLFPERVTYYTTLLDNENIHSKYKFWYYFNVIFPVYFLQLFNLNTIWFFFIWMKT